MGRPTRDVSTDDAIVWKDVRVCNQGCDKRKKE